MHIDVTAETQGGFEGNLGRIHDAYADSFKDFVDTDERALVIDIEALPKEVSKIRIRLYP